MAGLRDKARPAATTPVKRGDETTPGSIDKIEGKAARCRLREGQLDLVESGRAAILGD